MRHSAKTHALRSLSPDIAGLIVDRMDLPSLLAWRSTCTVNYAHVTAALKRTLTVMINPFLSQPTAILDTISRYGAVIGGEVALAYVRRHQPFQPRTLEIFAGVTLYDALCHEILSNPRISPDVLSTSTTINQFPYNLQRDLLETRSINLRSARVIYVHKSSSLSPLSPIARSLCTATMNFVTPHCFGCAYPRLTLNDKSLLSDIHLESMGDLDMGIIQVLAGQQIDMAVDPAMWRQYRMWSPTPAVTGSSRACWRTHHICPEQGRFFGDPGSLVDFIDPLGTSIAALRKYGSPPFGTMVVWRLSSSYQCPFACESHDSNLPLGHVSTAVILMDDPFVNKRRETRRTAARSTLRNRSLSV